MKQQEQLPEFLKLNKKEYRELIAEAIITLISVFMLYLGGFLILDQLLDFPFGFSSGDTIRHAFHITYASVQFYKVIYTGLALLFAFAFTYWRLMRRYHQMQLYHVLDELHLIANGDLTRRIPVQLNGDMGKVVESINRLVDSTVAAMEEERRSEKLKDELITNVSHDLRTPLTSIIGYLGLVTNSENIDADVARYTEIAYNKAFQMKKLVDDLFEYTTTMPNGVPLRLADIPVVPFLTQVTADFELEASQKGMTVEVDPNSENIILEMDAEKIVRVVHNLISNAIKYGKENTPITVSVKTNEHMAHITVENHGEPIPKETLQRLFGRFYRMERSRSQATGGTGLGLAIADNIVRTHGGSIYAESEQGLTRFVFSLPLTE